MSAAYYNEFDPYAAQWIRNLIANRLVAPGDVDERSIVDVAPDDLRGYTQCHFFAGIAGWSLAARIAGWPDDRELWTGSCPCQPFSASGQRKGQNDERHLWPEFRRLIAARRPAVVMGEQVAAAVGLNWLDGVLADLESCDYSGRAVVLPACAVDAPHRRDRLWFVADHRGERSSAGDTGQKPREEGVARVFDHDRSKNHSVEPVGDTAGQPEHFGFVRSGVEGSGTVTPAGALDVEHANCGTDRRERTFWSDHQWVVGPDGKARRVKPGVRLLADGFSSRVGRLRAYGNAIVPQVAAEVIAAYMECRP